MFILLPLLLLGYVYCGCNVTLTTGCINGISYVYADQFPCRKVLLNKTRHGCCAAGIPFLTASAFCCFDGVHPDVSGTCVKYNGSASNPTCYDCTFNPPANKLGSEKPHTKAILGALPPVDTSKPNTGLKCNDASKENGCLNSYPYDWEQQYPCYNWLLAYKTHGCCNGSPYHHELESCCYDEGRGFYYVSKIAHYCSCLKPNCNPNSLLS